MSEAFESVLAHVEFLARRFKRDNLRNVICVILMELGIHTNHDGFDYLVTGITLYLRNKPLVRQLGLYPAIARQYREYVTDKQIERSIRNAIAAAWKNFDPVDWIRYFPPESDGKIKKPCNTAFISRIARVLELWEGCCEETMNETCKEDLV